MPGLDDFEEWWKHYPRKIAKGDARRAWQQTASVRPLLDRLIRAVIVAKASEQWQKDEGQFIPYPATWLRGERWDDVHEIDLAAVTNGKAWHETVAGIESKAKELGLSWNAKVETFQQFSLRVRDAVNKQKIVNIS